ncbi:pyrroline-5-carboxylate reductase [Tersicoccus solisilvae]|uniref:Pyrroline-5-carboxylate reductase n=1 Tax=Tersicoccus solisilvae TaxID=1882339 RepID=A0ABQ1NNZ5_9MICC|nr:pyrroline-5-carboxylate reductase [Tersicoccus solisilvae]GGC81073.1 pyrroline-5-carboxylate reductase [Tersicoccus solisilvae]
MTDAPRTSVPSVSDARVAFIGTGSMNGSILAGVLASGKAPATVVATVRRPERAAALRQTHGITVLASAEDESANARAVEGADVVVLGVKPVGIEAMAREIAGSLSPAAVVVSVAAAVTNAMIEAALPAGQAVVRVMPNTPSRVRRGVLAASPGRAATPEQAALVEGVLAGSGVVVTVPEEQQDAVSAISGSGPAYVFYLAEAMTDAGVALGLGRDLAARLAEETVSGAGELLRTSDDDAATLRRGVTSPHGTTEQAIATFDREGLRDIVAHGTANAAARAAEITKELSGN